mmetsp:Transcript_23951/g.52109  ORF Transcript_23951/g.52109 Transcript_23951/m.52109 type:complete len:239 (+) Transcript_23951:27-743(+)
MSRSFSQESLTREADLFGVDTDPSDTVHRGESSFKSPRGKPGSRRRCHKVWLHIYDLDSMMATMNQSFLQQLGLGAFHTGVEVLGDEWYFRWAENEESGVVWMRPQVHQVHIYRESIDLGFSELTEGQIRTVLGEHVDHWRANTYHPVKRNCLHFAKAFVEALEVPEPFPAWVLGLPDAIQKPLLMPIADVSWQWMRWWNSSSTTCCQPQGPWLRPEAVEEVCFTRDDGQDSQELRTI